MLASPAMEQWVEDFVYGKVSNILKKKKTIDDLIPESLKEFDAVVLNNTCSKRPHRNLIFDSLVNQKDLTEKQRMARANILEKSLIDFVASGKGLMAIHGGVVFLNNSEDFGNMLGGSFVKHPKLQRITLSAVDPKHPLVQAFQ